LASGRITGLKFIWILCAGFGVRTDAGEIGVNFGAGFASLSPTDTAGAVPQDHFNNISGTPTSVNGLVADPDGAASSTAVQQTNVGLTITWSVVGSLNNNPTTPDAQLMDGLLLVQNALESVAPAPPMGVGFSGISSWTSGPYDVYAYVDSPRIDNPMLSASRITLTSASGLTTIYFRDASNFPGNGSAADYSFGASSDLALAGGANCVVFPNVVGDAFSLYGLGPPMTGGAEPLAINAVQIVEVPEPRLIAVACFAPWLLMRRRGRLRGGVISNCGSTAMGP
jgi:hypothetical protein